MSTSWKSILSAFVRRSRHASARAYRHRVRRHGRGKPRGGMTVVREYRRRNRR